MGRAASEHHTRRQCDGEGAFAALDGQRARRRLLEQLVHDGHRQLGGFPAVDRNDDVADAQPCLRRGELSRIVLILNERYARSTASKVIPLVARSKGLANDALGSKMMRSRP